MIPGSQNLACEPKVHLAFQLSPASCATPDQQSMRHSDLLLGMLLGGRGLACLTLRRLIPTQQPLILQASCYGNYNLVFPGSGAVKITT